MSKLISPYTHMAPDIRNHHQAKSAANSYAARSGTPYWIAAAFVSLTALMVLLLTVLMDNKQALEQVVIEQDSNNILANARNAFGQSNTVATDVLTTTRETVAITSPDTKTVTSASSTSASAPHAPQGESLEEFIAKPIAIDEPVNLADNVPVSSTDPSMPGPATVIPLPDAQTLNPLIQPPGTRVLSTRSEIINEIRVSHNGQAIDRQELWFMVNQHLAKMDNHHRDLDSRRRASITPAASAYNKIHRKRHSAFGRILKKPAAKQRHFHDSHRRSRQDFTRLPDEHAI